ncbi:MAG: tetratricopeptide repeat protein [Cyanobacteriota bacterium]|nr:tetratricopeptide repeat protein [Cyanobacteriota bacterium]
MSSTPRPPLSGSEHSPEETPSLERGLAALKQKQYRQAIAHLEAISQSQPHRSAGVRAQMGLVVAYERTRNIQKAIALCESLTQHPEAKVQAWAKKTLQELKNRYSFETQPQKKKTAKTPQDPGFVPFEPSSQSPNIQAPKDAGFVPFESPVKSTPEKPSVDAELNSLRSTVPKPPVNFESQPPQNQPKNQDINQIDPPSTQTPTPLKTPTNIEEIIEEKPLTEVQSFMFLRPTARKNSAPSRLAIR